MCLVGLEVQPKPRKRKDKQLKAKAEEMPLRKLFSCCWCWLSDTVPVNELSCSAHALLCPYLSIFIY